MSDTDVETRDASMAEDAGSAPAPEDTTQAADAGSAPAAEDVGSAPEGPSEAESKEELLKAVESVVETGGEDLPDVGDDEPAVEDDFQQPEAKAQSKPEDETETAPEELPDEVTEDETKLYSEKAQKRIKKLLAQRNAARDEAARIAPFQQFVEDNGLAGAEVSEGMYAMALLKSGNFEQFLQVVGPYVRQAQEYLGHALPQDLEQRVREGHMTSEAASQFARERMDRQLADTRAQEVTHKQEQTRQQAATDAMLTAVNVWEGTVKANDPDYETAIKLAEGYSYQLQNENGVPKTPDEAVAHAKKAYQMAKETLAKTIPTPQATPARPSSQTSAPASSMHAEPKTLLEAATQALMATGSR